MSENTPIIVAALFAAGSVVFAFASSRSATYVAGEQARMDQIDAARAADSDGFDIDAYYRNGITESHGGTK